MVKMRVTQTPALLQEPGFWIASGGAIFLMVLWWLFAQVPNAQQMLALQHWVTLQTTQDRSESHIPAIPPQATYHPIPLRPAAHPPFSAAWMPKHLATVEKFNPLAPPLRRYALTSMHLAGFVAQPPHGWMAVFTLPDHAVYRAAVGTRIGVQGARITQVQPDKIDGGSVRLLTRRGKVLVLHLSRAA